MHVRHARAVAELLGPSPAFLDLGTGGGIPGLVLADVWPDSRAVLLEAHQRRCAFLEEAIRELGLAPRVEVACGRAEALARDPRFRCSTPLVVARGFGPPAVTAECAVGFLEVGGFLAVTEPPGGSREPAERWPTAGLARLGFGVAVELRAGDAGVARMRLEHEPADRWPRRGGIPRKRPLW